MAVAMIGPKFYAWDRNGKPLAFGKLYTYQARTNTPKPTYQSEDQVVENTNPVILNGEGYANVYLDGSYKMVLKDQNDNEIWSSDPVSSAQPDEWVNCLSATYLSPTSFKVAGNFVDTYEPGRRIRIDNNTAEYAYSTIETSVFAGGETTITVINAVITTGIREVCASIVGPDSRPQDVVLNFSTLEGEITSATQSKLVLIGDVVEVQERTTDNGGGGKWDVVDVNDVTPNGYNIVQGVGNPDLAFVLRPTKYPGKEKIEEVIKPRQWGARAEEIGAVTGFDNSPVTQAIADHVTANGGAEVDWQNGAYYFASTVNIPSVDSGGLGQNGIKFKGVGRKTTELFTDQDIDMFTHADRLVVRDLSVVQRGTTNKFKGVAFRANGQCRFCIFENVEIWWFKFGNLQRFSLWNSYRDVYYVANVCGIKLARSDDMENQDNPSPSGSWNAGDGWFHNQNTFQNILFNGGKESDGGVGEIGFWGACMGCTFDNITAQNYERPGTHVNQTIPLGQVSTGMEIVGGGPSSTDSFNNVLINYYVERTFKALKTVDLRKLNIFGFFAQGQAGGERLIDADNSKIIISGHTAQSAGFTTRLYLRNNSVVISDGQIVASGATDDIEAGSFFSPYGIYTENGDIGDINNKFSTLWLTSDAYLGTESTDPKLTTDDGIYMQGQSGIYKASRGGYTLDLNSRAVNGPVALFHRSGGLRGSLGVTNNRGGAMENKMTENNVLHTAGSGSPEGAVSADVGSIYQRTDGGALTSFYVKETGAGNTGWVAK